MQRYRRSATGASCAEAALLTGTSEQIRLDAGVARVPRGLDLVLDGPRATRLATDLGLQALRKVRFAGTLTPVGSSDWDLEGTLGATATQTCVATLAPVTTRVDREVLRRYRTHVSTPEPGSETEMPEDDALEPLPPSLDLVEMIAEELSLALPDYPRAADADPVDRAVSEPGVTPLTDETAKPFAPLADLKRKLDREDP